MRETADPIATLEDAIRLAREAGLPAMGWVLSREPDGEGFSAWLYTERDLPEGEVEQSSLIPELEVQPTALAAAQWVKALYDPGT